MKKTDLSEGKGLEFQVGNARWALSYIRIEERWPERCRGLDPRNEVKILNPFLCISPFDRYVEQKETFDPEMTSYVYA